MCKHNLSKLAYIMKTEKNFDDKRRDSDGKPSPKGLWSEIHLDEIHQHHGGNEHSIEIIPHDTNTVIESANCMENIENVVTITKINIETKRDETEKHQNEQMNTNNIQEEAKVYEEYFDQYDNQMKPLDLKMYDMDSCNVYDSSYTQIDTPEEQYNKQPTRSTKDQLLHSLERRRLINREASRRYREKARGNPELLLKIREQQKKRQKKYYAKAKNKSI